MYRLTKISKAVAVVGLSTAMFMGQSIAVTIDSMNQENGSDSDVNSDVNSDSEASSVNEVTADNEEVSPVTSGEGVSQKLTGDTKTTVSRNKFLPSIKYTTEGLSTTAKKVNEANWTEGASIDRNTGTRLQALLNWHHNGVGAVDGYWGKNTRKAMQAFQQANDLAVTESLNDETWQALTKNEKLMTQPVLISYQLSEADINVKTTTIPSETVAKAKLEGMYYESLTESLAEKFHINEKYLKSLNPNAQFTVGEIITVYNPGTPNTKPVSRVVADKTTETLYAYDENNNLIASYPTTVGSTATPSPTGTHTVKVKVHEPNYTYTAEDGSKLIIPPGPNNPVGSVWIGLSKPTYGIHGSPDPARISRQASAGCIRLTNWDALSLLGVIQNGATVEFS